MNYSLGMANLQSDLDVGIIKQDSKAANITMVKEIKEIILVMNF